MSFRKSRDIEFKFEGESRTLKEWSKAMGMTLKTTYKKILEQGISKEELLSGKRAAKKYKAFGMEKNADEWSKHFGIAPKTIRNRIARGWSIDKAVSHIPNPRKNSPWAFGRCQSYASWAKEFGLTYDLIWNRMRFYGDTLEEALIFLSKGKE